MCPHTEPETPFVSPHFRRDVVARFDGGSITSDGGELLLRETETRAGIIAGLFHGTGTVNYIVIHIDI